jgi:hypothetical protein
VRYLTCSIVFLCVGSLQTFAAEPSTVTPAPAQASPDPAPGTVTPPAPVTPPTALTTPSPVAPATAVAPPPSVAAAPAVSGAKAESPQDVELDKQTKRLRSQGYKPKVQNGRTVFCRREVVLGSHFGVDVCGTADELDKTTANARRPWQICREGGSLTRKAGRSTA